VRQNFAILYEAIPIIKVAHGLGAQQFGGYQVSLFSGAPRHRWKQSSHLYIGLMIHHGRVTTTQRLYKVQSEDRASHAAG
jgi:hypothetical protein